MIFPDSISTMHGSTGGCERTALQNLLKMGRQKFGSQLGSRQARNWMQAQLYGGHNTMDIFGAGSAEDPSFHAGKLRGQVGQALDQMLGFNYNAGTDPAAKLNQAADKLMKAAEALTGKRTSYSPGSLSSQAVGLGTQGIQAYGASAPGLEFASLTGASGSFQIPSTAAGTGPGSSVPVSLNTGGGGGASGSHQQIIAAAASKYGVPFWILWGIYRAESAWGQNPAGAGSGWFGLIGSGAGGVNPGSNLQQDAEIAASTLAQLYKQYGSWALAIQHYSGNSYTIGHVQQLSTGGGVTSSPAASGGGGRSSGGSSGGGVRIPSGNLNATAHRTPSASIAGVMGAPHVAAGGGSPLHVHVYVDSTKLHKQRVRLGHHA